MQGLPSILSLFLNWFNKFNDSNGARDLEFVRSHHLDYVPNLCVQATKALTRLWLCSSEV